jgi:hypothetical protein
MTDMFDFLRRKQGRVDYLRNQLGEFAHENRDVLIIVGDPKTDQMFVAYKDKMVLGSIKSLDGKSMHVIKDVLRQSAMKSSFDAAIDSFTGGLVDVLKVGLEGGNQFFSHISNVLFAFQTHSKEWTEKRKRVEAVLSEQSN